MRSRPSLLALLALCAALLAAAPRSASAQEALSIEDLRQMSIDELASLEVTSVSLRSEPLSAAAAAVYVITQEEIRRFGATSLPEALRLAPNLDVTRADARGYAVSARGFNSAAASNKLLVLIDGRTVYSPLHSGVFWDAQDVLLADVERIEVISGPGGTLWGANAVNGVINIITKTAADSEGGLVTGTYGTVSWDAGARYGARLSEALAVRVYGKGFERGHAVNADGTDNTDTWNRMQGGLRAEWSAAADVLTLQGDLYESHVTGVEDAQPGVTSALTGGNVLARWRRTLSATSHLQVQGYYDRTGRDQEPVLAEDVDTYDLGVQHRFRLGSSHDVVWGGGYRIVDDRFANVGAFLVADEGSSRRLGSFFVQDDISLSDALTFTAGAKLEDHTFTDLEYMPNVRLAWRASDAALLWASVSRAVRTPSRLDRDLHLPGFLAESPSVGSEIVTAYEAGYRGQPLADLVLSVSAFFNQFDDLRTLELQPGGALPAFLAGGLEGTGYGVEVYGHYSIVDAWRLSGGVTAMKKELELKPGFTDISNFSASGNDPSYHFVLRSLLSPVPGLEIDVGVRGVGERDTPEVPGWVGLDARVAWQRFAGLELFAAGFDLLEERRPQVGDAATRHEIRRSVAGGLTWRF